MPAIVLRDIAHLVTFDDDDRELTGVDLLVQDGRVAAIGARLDVPATAEVIDASGLLVLPGLVNAHQHLYQVGLRCLPGHERELIGPWLRGVTIATLEAWRSGRFSPRVVHAVARAGLVESVLTGVTTVADQHYIFPGGTDPYVEAVIDAAHEIGVRLNAGRGSLTLPNARGGGAPPELIQTVDEVARHCAALVERHHDPAPFAKLRIDLAPCGVHADELALFDELAALAAEHDNVGLHTHLYEVVDTAFARERHGTTPWRLVAEHGWAQPRTWLAHMVDTPLDEIGEMAAAGVGIVHLIGPDLRMGWGLAPVRAYLDHGCRLGFGTTGSASNDGANQLGDLRVAALAHRMGDQDPTRWPSARELLRMATRGSADVLHRPECGHLSIGAAADLAAWDLRTVDRVGVHDPVAGLLLTGISDRANLVLIGGEIVVRAGRCTVVDEAEVAATARAALAGPT